MQTFFSLLVLCLSFSSFFFFNDTATTEIYTLSLHDALPIFAGITQMTSTSQLGSTNVTLQFDLSRNIDAAARDVQAAINAARGQLPADLPGQPTYRKVNPADAPILLLSLTSTNIPRAQVYDAADSILAQKLAQVEG